MDRRQDKNATWTPADSETSGPLAQDCYCSRGSGRGAEKQRGNGEE